MGTTYGHFGNEKVKLIKGPINAQKHINLLTMHGFDEVSLANSFGDNLIKQNNENLDKIINNLKRISTDPNDWFNKDLIWCEKNRWGNWGNKIEISCEFTKRWLYTNYNFENLSVLFLPQHAIVQKIESY